jgi:Ornithine cyclodeaminase/mu-crystallin family
MDQRRRSVPWRLAHERFLGVTRGFRGRAHDALYDALNVMLTGDPGPIQDVWSRHDDVTDAGRAHIDAIATMFPGSRVLVHSRSPQRLERLITDYADAACQLEPTGSFEQTVRESDALIVSTAHLPEPILRTEWLHPGQNVLNVHSRAWPSDVLASVDRVSCDDRRPIVHAEHGLLEVYPCLDPDIELGEVATGQKVGRESPDQIIFSFNYGLALFDVLVADYVVRALGSGGAAAVRQGEASGRAVPTVDAGKYG